MAASGTLSFKEDDGLKGEEMWNAAVAVDRKVFGIPASGGKILIYDTESDILSFEEDDGLKGENMWFAAVAVDRKVIGIPYSGGKIVIYDTESDTLSFKEDDGLKGEGMWFAAVAVDRKVIGIPSFAGKIVIYDTDSDTLSFKEDDGLKGEGMWFAAVAVDRKVIGIPRRAGKIVIYDTESDTLSFKEDDGLKGEGMWIAAVAVDRKVIGIPRSAGKIIIYDTESDILSFKEDDGSKGEGMWFAAVAVDRKVIGIPRNAGKIVIYDTESDTLSFNEDDGLKGEGMWVEAVAVDRKVIGIPSFAGKILIYDTESDILSFKEDDGLKGKHMWLAAVAVDRKVIGIPFFAGKIALFELTPAAASASTPKASPASPEGQRTFENTLFREKYKHIEAPQYQHEVFAALLAMLTAICVLKGVSEGAAHAMFRGLQADALSHSRLDEILDEIPRLAVKLWTSAFTGIGGKEFCSLLNEVIRLDSPGVAFDKALILVRLMNTLLVTRRKKNKNKLQWPPNMVSYRGTGMPMDEIQRFAIGVMYRSAMFLATAFQQRVAFDFLKRVPSDLVPVLFFFHLDENLACDHALYLEGLTLVPDEGEFLYVPYSAFTPTSIAIPDGNISWSRPVEIHVDVAPDNKLVPDSVPVIMWH